jgi:hypothetical protein
MRRAARKDLNHNDIAGHLRSLGWSVLDTSRLGDGFPDMVIGKPGFACVMEVKSDTKPSTLALTEKERKVRDRWDGPYIVATSKEDALAQLACMIQGIT